MTPADLDRLEVLAAAATPGPWRAHAENRKACRAIVETEDREQVADATMWDIDQCRENADFIAASRTAVPALIAEVRKAQAQRANMAALFVVEVENHAATSANLRRARAELAAARALLGEALP